MEKFVWALKKDEIFQKFNTDPIKGLDENIAQKRLSKYGLNELPKNKQSFLKIYLAPLFNWLIVIYLIAALIMFIAGMITGSGNMSAIYITLAIVALNCIVAIFQQARATKKLNSLRQLSAPKTKIIRNGQKEKIFTKNLVIGDLLDLCQGDKIPADARIIHSSNLRVNESSLTGESEPVRKNSGISLDNIPLHLQNQENILFYGTFISTGNCSAIVISTGANTEIGKISMGLIAASSNEIPIRKKLNNIGKWFGIGVISIWFLILIFLFIVTGEIDVIKSLNSAMDIMPINIPLLTTIIMLTGVLKMADHGVIIRNLTSVDSLGRVSVVCSDKTGTLTRSQMCVQHVWARGSHFRITGSGYMPSGEIFLVDNPQNPIKIDHIEQYPHLKLLLIAGYLNNNSSIIMEEREVKKKKKEILVKDWTIIGNPTEGALKVLHNKILDPLDLGDYEEILEYPFDSKLKLMSKIYRNSKKKNYVYTKGASEIVIFKCSKMLAENNSVVDFIIDMKLIVLNRINEYARQGYRILSIAYKNLDFLENPKYEDREQIESDLIYIGFVAILDPPRSKIKEAVEKCHNSGIKVVMITGDSLNTAKAIASQISIIRNKNEKIMEGNEIESLDDLRELDNVKVFARVSPKHKEIIVSYLQKTNHVVAMTGDGVNDALALNMADAGISMGLTGTDVAKDASDMILSDDSFESIVEGINRGRGIFANIRSVVFFFICINLFEGIVQFIIAVILDKPYFLDDTFYYQWIFLSLTLHMFPGLILTFDSVSKDIMKESPRNSEEILSKKFLYLLLIYGGLLAISMLITYFLAVKISPVVESNYDFGNLNPYYLFSSNNLYLSNGVNLDDAKSLTMVMTTLFFCECALALQIRRPNKSLLKSIKEERNIFMFIVIGILFLVFLLFMYFPNLQVSLAKKNVNLQFMFLNLLDWLICFMISFICIGTFELVKFIARKNNIKF